MADAGACSSRELNTTVLPIKDCVLCFSSHNNESLFGVLYKYKDKHVHERCLFFSSNLSQRGDDDEGILGFLFEDIEKEINRGSKLNCSYCKKKGATIGCCIKKCKKNFHLPCGLERKCLNQFYDQFRSYCKSHKPHQSVPQLDTIEFYCHICFENIPREDRAIYIYSPCCFNNLFHRTCLQSYATSSGMHFFCCPLCKDKTTFVKEMLLHGIYVPDRDASWEMVPDAFNDLQCVPSCSALLCKCENGKEFNGTDLYLLLSCYACGSSCHRICANVNSFVTSWLCPTCKNVLGH